MLQLLNLSSLPLFMLVLVRVLAFFVTMPLFSYRTLSTPFKLGFGFFLALMMVSAMDVPDLNFDVEYLLLLLKEICVGLFTGLIAYIILSAIQIAGGFIDFQMGFAIANVIDPQTGAQSPLTGQYLYIISLLFLLSVDAHHLLIDGIYYSYQLIPADQLINFGREPFAEFVISVFSQMFLIAFQMAIPVVGCLFLVDLALGIIAKAVPQMNVFVVGMPLKIFVSFVAIVFFLALYIGLAKRLFHYMFATIHGFMQLLGGA